MQSVHQQRSNKKRLKHLIIQISSVRESNALLPRDQCWGLLAEVLACCHGQCSASFRSSTDEVVWLVSWKRQCVNSCFGSKTWSQAAAADTQKAGAAKPRLRTAKANVQRLVRATVRKFWAKIITEVRRCFEAGDVRGIYNVIKSAIEPHPVRTSLLSAQGSIIQDPSLQLDRWVEHYSSIYSQKEHFTMDTLSHLPELPVLYDLDA